MYSPLLREFAVRFATAAQVDPLLLPLLRNSVSVFVERIARSYGGYASERVDAILHEARLLFLSQAASSATPGELADSLHYLAALGFEHLVANFDDSVVPPENDESWFRLLASSLHYMAGGFRVQAMTGLRRLRIDAQLGAAQAAASQYVESVIQGASLDSVRVPTQGTALDDLARRVRERAQIVLAALGEGSVENWLVDRQLPRDAVEFWSNYLARLKERGITGFTKEQGSFNLWLRRDRDVLVVLPTGGGKSIVGELLTALSLAASESVIWMLPTKALVRQVKRDMSDAFYPLGIEIEDLPVSEDARPLFHDIDRTGMRVSVATPERLYALSRARPDAFAHIGCVVVDEAHLLVETGRGASVEEVLQSIRAVSPGTQVVLMTSAEEVRPALRSFLSALQSAKQLQVVSSELRPTRRLYGILTETNGEDGRSAGVRILLHPPVPATDSEPCVAVFPPERSRQPSDSPTEIASRFLRRGEGSRLRVVTFLQQRRSTETQAEDLARGRTAEVRLDSGEVERLRTELGRESVLERTAPMRIAPHHAGMAPIEQVFAEKWLDSGRLRTIFATPTLAQGMNLPFDMSILTYTSRFVGEGLPRAAIPPSELLNMLGRAGRAGRASDGVCLISVAARSEAPTDLLSDSKSVFFPQVAVRETGGLAELLAASSAELADPRWLGNLSGFEFGRVQSILSFLGRFVVSGGTSGADVQAFLTRFPSIRSLRPASLARVCQVVAQKAAEVRSISADLAFWQLLAATGLPPEFLLRLVRDLPDVDALEGDLDAIADRVVMFALTACRVRPWFEKLFEDVTFDEFAALLPPWRTGAPLAVVEAAFALGRETQSPAFRADAIRLGGFLNSDLSLLAQFWAAVPVCYELAQEDEAADAFRSVPARLREGVPTTDAVVWLRVMGAPHRVLATQLSEAVQLEGPSLSARLRGASRLAARWRAGTEQPPPRLARAVISALQ